MNQSYTQEQPGVDEENDVQDLAHETAEKISGPLTGREIEKTVAPRSARRQKSASAFRTISEVADVLDVQQHVLRFWETKFSQVRPLKRGGGRRYYRPEDLELLKKIHHLLYTEGYTIKGVQKLLREKGKAGFLEEEKAQPQNSNQPSVKTSVQGSLGGGMSKTQRAALQAMVGELKALRGMIKPE